MDEYVAYAFLVDGSAFKLDDMLNTPWHQGVQVGEVVADESAPNCKGNYGKGHFVLLVFA